MINKNKTLKFLSIILIITLMLVAVPSQLAYGATLITVNTQIDELNSDGDCSLREAIETANTGVQVDNCTDPAIGGVPYTITVPAGTYTLTTGTELLTTVNMIINGAGGGTTIIEANAAKNSATYRVLRNNGGTVIINGVTLQHGVCNGGCAVLIDGGGGIYNFSGTTTIDASTVSANTADVGGGIYNLDTLNIQNGSVIGGAGAANSATYYVYFNPTPGYPPTQPIATARR